MRESGMEEHVPKKKPEDLEASKGPVAKSSLAKGGIRGAIAGVVGLFGVANDTPPAKAVGQWDSAPAASVSDSSYDDLPKLPTEGAWQQPDIASDAQYDLAHHDGYDSFQAGDYDKGDVPIPDGPSIVARRPDDQEIPTGPDDKKE